VLAISTIRDSGSTFSILLNACVTRIVPRALTRGGQEWNMEVDEDCVEFVCFDLIQTCLARLGRSQRAAASRPSPIDVKVFSNPESVFRQQFVTHHIANDSCVVDDGVKAWKIKIGIY
jgi:hypothetical protein